MRHLKETGDEEFAIHEVYFDDLDKVVTYTEAALSPREISVETLKVCLLELLAQSEDGVALGDLGYVYSREDIQLWLEHIETPPIDHK